VSSALSGGLNTRRNTIAGYKDNFLIETGKVFEKIKIVTMADFSL